MVDTVLRNRVPNRVALGFSTALALSIVASACGSDDAGSNSSTDTVAPVLTLIASSSRAEAGAQVGLSATANDATDGLLTASISCTGGTVQGSILTTPMVSTPTDISCTAQATDKAGNVGRTSVNITVGPPTTEKIALAADSTSLMPGQVGGLSLTAIPMIRDDYEGRIGSAVVKLRRVDPTTLGFALPTGLTPGTYNLTIDIEGKAYVVPVAVLAKPVVTNAKAEVLAAAQEAETSLAATLAGLPSSASSLERGQYTQALERVRQAIATIDTLSAADLQIAAEVLAANNVSPLKRVANDSEACAAARAEYSSTDARITRKQRILILATAGIIYTGIGTGGLTAIIGGVALGITISELKDDVQILLSLSGNVIAKCVVAIDDELVALITGQKAVLALPLSVVSKATGARIGFSSGVARDFNIRRTFDVLPDFAASLKPQFLAAQQRVASFTFLPESIRGQIAAFQLTRTETVPASRLSVGGPSNANVTGSVAANGTALRLTYRIASGNAASEDFQFALSDPSVNLSTVVLASVSAGPPEAAGATARVRQDQAVSIPVQVKFATSLEVVGQPANGTVSVNGIDGFTYRPRAGFSGNDSFTYVAVNSAGRSQAARVDISVQRDYAGLWNINYNATITSGANICGAESFSGQVTVVRQSDTVYSFSVVGNTVTLRQASADDPKGLSGSATLTFPEDNGTTVSNITINVPTASTMNGTSNWRWSNAAGQACTGVGTITGGRP